MAKFRSSNKPLRSFKPQQRTVPTGTYQFDIVRRADDGRGIATYKGKTVFVKAALPGEQVDARYTASHKNFDEAECIAVKRASSERIDPRCEYFKRCGGCDLQHVNYQRQLSDKQQSLQHLFSPLEVNHTIQWMAAISSEPFGYRHRARLAVKTNRNHCSIGFRESGSHDIVAIDHCHVLYPTLSQRLPLIQTMIASLQSRSLVQELSIAEDSYQQQGIILYCKQLLSAGDLDRIKRFSVETGIVVELWRLKSSDQQPLWCSSNTPLHYVLAEQNIDLCFSLTDFTQVNPRINQAMVNRAIEWLCLDKSDTVADFFCGMGNFSLALAAQAGTVIGYELIASMVAKAEANAVRNKVNNAEFKVFDLMNANQPGGGLFAGRLFNKVILDPPRAGAEWLCQQLAVSAASHIVYISCNPQTLLRDAKILTDGGYQLRHLALADMFPQTVHSEVVSLFTADTIK